MEEGELPKPETVLDPVLLRYGSYEIIIPSLVEYLKTQEGKQGNLDTAKTLVSACIEDICSLYISASDADDKEDWPKVVWPESSNCENLNYIRNLRQNFKRDSLTEEARRLIDIHETVSNVLPGITFEYANTLKAEEKAELVEWVFKMHQEIPEAVDFDLSFVSFINNIQFYTLVSNTNSFKSRFRFTLNKFR